MTLFARGSQIRGAGDADDRATFTLDGDSYAAPLAAGVAAIYLEAHPRASPAEVKDALVSSAAPRVRNAGGAPNRLLQIVR